MVTMVLTVHLLAVFVFVPSCVSSCVCSSVSSVSSLLESVRGMDKLFKVLICVFHVSILVGSHCS